MNRGRLKAEWFWIDRWRGSSAAGLPLEARGLYREMLTAAWFNGAALPNDPVTIQRLIGATAAEWRRSWPAVARYWRVDGASLVNDTQRAVYADARKRYEKAATRAAKGGEANAARFRTKGPRLGLVRQT